MFESMKYHTTLQEDAEIRLPQAGTDFRVVDYENQRRGVPEDVIETQASNFRLQNAGIVDWEDVQTDIISDSLGTISKLAESADTDQILDTFINERGYEETGEEIDGISVYEGEDNVYYGGGEDYANPAAVALDMEAGFLIYASDNITLEDHIDPVEQVIRSLQARENDQSFVDQWGAGEGEDEGQLYPFVKEENSEDSFLYQDDIIDFHANMVYRFLDEYREGRGLGGMTETLADYGIGAVLQEDNPEEEVDIYRTKFDDPSRRGQTDDSAEILEPWRKVGEHDAEIIQLSYPNMRDPEQDPNYGDD